MSTLNRLIRKVRRGEVVLWAGAGFSLYAGLPSGKQLSDAIIKEAEPEEKEILHQYYPSLPDVSEEFVQMRKCSKTDLIKILKSQIDITPKSLTAHTNLSKIPQIKQIVSTNFDTLFEQAYRAKLNTIINDTSIPISNDPNKSTLYKIHGDFSNLSSLVITKSDYNDFFISKEQNPIWNKIRSLISEYSILFIGYSFSDPNVQVIFEGILKHLGEFQNESYFVCPDLPKHKQDYLATKKIAYIDMSGEDLVKSIKEDVYKHLISDCESGFINPVEVSTILNEEGISPRFEISDRLILKSIKSTDGTKISGKIKLTLHKNDLITQKITELFDGKLRGDIILPPSVLNSIESSIKGINLPLFEKFTQLTITPNPMDSFSAHLMLAQSDTLLSSVNIDIYSYTDAVEIKISHPVFNLDIFYNTDTSEQTITITNNNYKNSYLAAKAYEFLLRWAKEEDIIILCEENPKSLPTIISLKYGQIPDIIDMITYFHEFYLLISKIQKYFNIYLEIPKEITDEDLKTLDSIKFFIEGKKVKIPECASIIRLNGDATLEDFEKAFCLNNVSLKSITNENTRVTLFGVELELGKECIESLDAIIKNVEEAKQIFLEGNKEIPVTFISPSNEMYFYYFKD